jgi:uncharacterized small protein (TIGR04563 family)
MCGNLAFEAESGYALGMGPSDKRKQSLYFPEQMLQEISAEATRQDRSLSWIVQKAWKAARRDIMGIPAVSEPVGEGSKGEPAK